MNPIFQNYDYLFKIILLSERGMGKSCLLLRYTDGTYSDSYISTIGVDFKIKGFELNGKKFKLQIWEPAGSERFLTLTRSYYRGAHGIIILYDTTNQESFDDLKKWIKEIQEKGPDDANIMIMGTKIDLVSQKVIDTETGKNFAEQLGYSFFETSSKENINIDEAFELLTNQIYQRVKQIPQEKPKSNQNSNQKDKKGYGDYRIDILLIGDRKVGKSNLRLRYCEDTFTDENLAIIGDDLKMKVIEKAGKVSKILIWDPTPNERYRQLILLYYKKVHGIIIVYDVTNQESFDNIKKWVKEIQNNSNDNVNVILIGTKIDLDSQKVIDTETGKKLAEQLGYSFFETSSKENININEAFETMIIQIEKRNHEKLKKNSNSNSKNNQNEKKDCLLM
ncbi:gtp-binding protein yptm2 [Anaeramoeba ignava]|uniref:Gtp-binding protein yptm2 n=1 Tax=Anaeramoeba ignava TaxID=1746090 RepID=A0A9Q0LDM5_ANAIG|nr:gtp-binding protein yptm2 [Anaeramoeba ignava]